MPNNRGLMTGAIAALFVGGVAFLAHSAAGEKSTASPLMLIDLSSTTDTFDNIFLANYAFINLNDELTRVPGVASVSIFGAGGGSAI